jgi:hypothetical protein
MTIVRRLHLAHPEIAKILLLDTYDRGVVVTAFRSGVKGCFAFPSLPFGFCASVFRAFIRGRCRPTVSNCSTSLKL